MKITYITTKRTIYEKMAVKLRVTNPWLVV